MHAYYVIRHILMGKVPSKKYIEIWKNIFFLYNVMVNVFRQKRWLCTNGFKKQLAITFLQYRRHVMHRLRNQHNSETSGFPHHYCSFHGLPALLAQWLFSSSFFSDCGSFFRLKTSFSKIPFILLLVDLNDSFHSMVLFSFHI